MKTARRRFGGLILAVMVAFTVAAVPTACTGPSNGPRPSGGAPSY